MQRVSEWVIVVKRQMGILFSGISPSFDPDSAKFAGFPKIQM